MPDGRITIVIPTHNRPLQILQLLRSIQKYTCPEVDSIVVVDDSDKGTTDLTGEFPDLNLTHLIFQNRLYISRAKNIGWKRTNSEYIFFLDDDNVVGVETINATLGAISKMRDAGAIMPAVLYKSNPNLVWVYAAPFACSPPDFELIGRNLPRNPSLENRYYNTDALPNASIIRRDALEQVGGFNEQLLVNSSMDMALRLKKATWKVYAFTGAFIFHDVEPPGKMGWWGVHGWTDPQRVRYEIRDWFLIRRNVREGEKFLTAKSIIDSMRFLLPNSLAYVVRGESRRRVLLEEWRGFVEGIVVSSR